MFALNQQEMDANNDVVVGTLSIDSIEARILFDSGATHSFCPPSLAQRIYRLACILESPLRVATLLGKAIKVRVVYKGCEMIVGTQALPADLILIDIVDFDTILGMDWLATHHATLDYRMKKVVFNKLGILGFSFQRND